MRESAKQLTAYTDDMVKGFGQLKDALAIETAFGTLATNAELASARLYELAGVPKSDIEKGRGSTLSSALGATSSSIGNVVSSTSSNHKATEWSSGGRLLNGPKY